MRNMQITQHGLFEVATAEDSRGLFVAWAKMGKISGSCPILEPGGHVWVCHGATRDDAKQAVLADVGLANV